MLFPQKMPFANDPVPPDALIDRDENFFTFGRAARVVLKVSKRGWCGGPLRRQAFTPVDFARCFALISEAASTASSPVTTP